MSHQFEFPRNKSRTDLPPSLLFWTFAELLNSHFVVEWYSTICAVDYRSRNLWNSILPRQISHWSPLHNGWIDFQPTGQFRGEPRSVSTCRSKGDRSFHSVLSRSYRSHLQMDCISSSCISCIRGNQRFACQTRYKWDRLLIQSRLGSWLRWITLARRIRSHRPWGLSTYQSGSLIETRWFNQCLTCLGW